MKFSASTVLLLANGIAAIPWSLGSHQTDVKADDTINLQIKISKEEMLAKTSPVTKFDICWLVCYFEKPNCPEHWYPKDTSDGQGGCWTCCRSPDGDL